jgi:hypothetical protein
MTPVRAVLLATLISTISATPAAAGPKVDAKPARTLLREAIDLYVEGKYKQAAEHLRPLVESKVLKDLADQQEALRTYGISLFLSGAKPASERAFRALLRMNPAEKLEPSFVRPEVITFFDQVRKRYRGELTEIVRKRRPKYRGANLLPPWGQFQNGHRTKGFWVMGGELVFGLSSIVTFALLTSWKDDHNVFGENEAAAEVIQPINWACFAATAVVVIYGIIDGFYYYYKQPRTSGSIRVGLSSPRYSPARSPLTIRF